MRETLDDRILLDVRPAASDAATDLEELRAGLLASPRRIPSKHFYDRRGSALFERITELPEYYLTRAERALLEHSADEIAAATEAEELVELGSGAATKTRLLLDAMARRGCLRLYVPVDVSESEVRRVALELVGEYPGLRVHGMVADFTRHLDDIPPGDPRLVILLGSTVGNYARDPAVALLRQIARPMAAGDFFLLGADLVKDPAVIEAAYNDAAGVTAEFNRNILRVVNRLASADFDPAAFRHQARYDRDERRIEIWLVAERRQRVRLTALDLDLELAAGEPILTELSCKYDRQQVDAMLAASGFRLAHWLTDPGQRFGLALASRV